MRILMLTETSHLGGAEVMIRNLALELRARGHEVGLVAPSNGGPWLHEAMRQDGFPVWQFSLKGAINPELLATIRRAVAEFRPDVMHSHLWVMAAYGGLVAAIAGVPHVITMHGDGEQTKFLRRRVALRLAFSSARSVVAVSDAMREDLARSLGIPPGKMLVVANGSAFPAGDRTGTRAALGIDEEAFVVACVGSQIPRKNHIVVVAAMALLDRGVNWRLLVIGPHGDATAALSEAASRLEVADRVLNLGPRHNIPDLLAAADLYVMPSLWEGMPVALVEAMGAGKPIIASATGGIPDMIQDGVEGSLLRDPTDPHPLASMIDALRKDAAKRESLGAGARRKASADYGAGTMADTYLELYQRRGIRP